MATRTKPLISAVALASAAAVAVATPSIAPNLAQPTPGQLSRAAYELTTFSDVLSVPPNIWTDILFCSSTCNGQWGGRLSGTPNAEGTSGYGPEWAKPRGDSVTGEVAYVNPWAQYCDGTCYQANITGAAYLFFDALINGDGQGYDPAAPGKGWNIGLVNYFFEPNTVFTIGGGSSPGLQYVSEGFSAATWYLLQGTLGQAVPALTLPIAAAFWGPSNVSVGYNLALTAIANLAKGIPAVGPLIGNSIIAYLGDLQIPGSDPAANQFYQYGLSGALNYWVDIATGAVPFPTATTTVTPPAAVVAAKTAAPAAAAAVADSSPASDSTPAADSTPASDSTPAADSTPASDSTPAEETAPAEETTPAVEVTAVAETKAATPDAPATKPAPKRPFKDAVEKVSKQINAAIDNAKSKAAARSAATKDRVAKAAAGAN